MLLRWRRRGVTKNTLKEVRIDVWLCRERGMTNPSFLLRIKMTPISLNCMSKFISNSFQAFEIENERRCSSATHTGWIEAIGAWMQNVLYLDWSRGWFGWANESVPPHFLREKAPASDILQYLNFHFCQAKYSYYSLCFSKNDLFMDCDAQKWQSVTLKGMRTSK